MYKIAMLLSATVLSLLGACSKQVDQSESEKSVSSPKSAAVLHVDHLKNLYNRFDPKFPGRGITDYPGHTVEDIPKAYAQILLAELDRHKLPAAASWPDLGVTAGFWLLQHSDENNDGVTGWGVPVAWDAYGDGTINPKNTEYTISTGIVVRALLDWIEKEQGAPREEILKVVSRAMKPYLESGVLSPSGLMPYSLASADRQYDTFNPAAYMAGQMQRFSHITRDKNLAKKLKKTADLTMHALLVQHKVSQESGTWYWTYSIQEDNPNDLPHASYIIEGIASYVKYGGRLANDFDMPRIYAHLEEFMVAGEDNVRGWPRFWSKVKHPARSYDIGIALSLACSTPALKELRQPLSAAIDRYRDGRGAYLRNPVGAEGFEPIVVTEYEAYLYRGVARCSLTSEENKDLGIIELHFPKLKQPSRAHPIPSVSPRATQTMSGISLGSPLHPLKASFNVAASMSTVQLPQGVEVRFQKPGIPIWMQDDGEGHWTVFFRSISGGRLSLLRVRKLDGRIEASDINRISESELIFRAARWHSNKLYLVVYDNLTQSNYLMRFIDSPQGYKKSDDIIRLPLLEDPAGGTYEMIPGIYFAESGDKLYLLGGTLKAIVPSQGSVQESRIKNCLRVIEVAETPSGPAILCQAKLSEEPLAPFFVSGPEDLAPPQIRPGNIPWNLRFENGKLRINDARADGDLAAMLKFDLLRIQQSGWMEFGIDNAEGRIPWSQIYYLNGYLDILLLSRTDAVFRERMSPLLQTIRQRLDLEMQLIDRVWSEGRYPTRAFTVDRSPALFAVQTSRLLLLMERYLSETPHPLPLNSYKKVKSAVIKLDRHIEVLMHNGEKGSWIKPGTPYLRWPKGSKFYFDGTPVPFNHQNEWAYALLFRADPNNMHSEAVDATNIVRFFLNSVSQEGELPRVGEWNYWWGTAYDGWSVADDVSINKPEYSGDKIKAWISFRTIDVMASIAASPLLDAERRSRLLSSVASLILNGRVYPFASYEFMRQGLPVFMRGDIALQYIRVSSPWELQNAVWAYLYLSHIPPSSTAMQ